jgi:hypothetical protein
LIIDKVYILGAARIISEGDDADHISEVDLVAREKVNIKLQLKILCKTEGVVGGKVEAGPLFLDDFMAVEYQTIRLGKIAGWYK